MEEFGPPEKLKLVDLPIPEPEPNEVQIKIAYTGVNPVDWKICEGLLKTRMPHEFPIIPGWEASGIVSKLGSKVKNLKIGDPVFAYIRKPTVQKGTYAEYICFDANHVVLKPSHLSFAQAASIPLTGLTAWQALVERANIQPGQTVLIHAGAGGVGGMAIQIAHHFKASIFTTASSQNHEYVRRLGAQFPIDYTKEDFVAFLKKQKPEGASIVFDTVGKDTHEKSYGAVKKGGWLISICTEPDQTKAKEHGINAGYVFVRPEGEHLKKLSQFFESGEFMAPPIEEFPLIEAAAALNKLKTGHVKGKLVLAVS